jgi:hypothetical protein
VVEDGAHAELLQVLDEPPVQSLIELKLGSDASDGNSQWSLNRDVSEPQSEDRTALIQEILVLSRDLLDNLVVDSPRHPKLIDSLPNLSHYRLCCPSFLK